MMSVTGVLLTYERQIIEWVEQQHTVDNVNDRELLSADALISLLQHSHQDAKEFELKFVNRTGAAVDVRVGNDGNLLLDPYTGDVLRQGRSPAAQFFRTVTQVHRWFAVRGEGFDTARAITAYSNLLFVLLIVSGIYLWLPKIWRWPLLRTKILWRKENQSSKDRDYNWHHVFSFWSLIPLLFICLTATVFYFPWANSALYAAFGEEPPARGRGGVAESTTEESNQGMTQQSLLLAAIEHANLNGAEDWYSIQMETNGAPGAAVNFTIDRSIGRRLALAYNLTLDGKDGTVLKYERRSDLSLGRQARGVVRFLHTGEVFGFLGQTIAGLASLAACFLVYTGLALAWRRLFSPLLGRA